MLSSMVKEQIGKFVVENPGVTGVEIVVGLFSKENHSVDVPVVLEQMVNEGLLTEMEYVLKLSDYRVHSLFFAPKQPIDLVRGGDTIRLLVNDKEIKSFPADTTISIVKP